MKRFLGRRALVVEDEGGVALLLEDMLSQLGWEIAASVARLQKACEIARNANLDLAVLDVNLAGEPVFPAAEILRERGIPFIFSTGYGAGGIPREFAGYGVLSKPFSVKQLAIALCAALRRRN